MRSCLYSRYKRKPQAAQSRQPRTSSRFESVTRPLRGGSGARYEPLGVDTRRRLAAHSQAAQQPLRVVVRLRRRPKRALDLGLIKPVVESVALVRESTLREGRAVIPQGS